MKKYIILLLALCSMSACDYEAVNTNPYRCLRWGIRSLLNMVPVS